jgi:hypothetical protein
MSTVVDTGRMRNSSLDGQSANMPLSWRMRLFSPVDISVLVFFRVFFGAMMVYHVYSMISSGWIEPLYTKPVMHFTYPGFGWVRPWPGNGMHIHFYVMGVAALGVTIGCLYRLAALVLALGMAHVFLIEKAFYLNHYYLMALLSALLVVLPANRAFSVDAWLRPGIRLQQCPAWCLWLLRLQLAIPYFFGGLAKLDSDWLQGFPLGMWLRRRGTLPWLQGYVDWEWTPIFFSYGGLLFDLLVVPMLLWKRTRPAAYAVAVLFHLMNASLFEIGIFPWMMIGATLVFFPADWPRRLLRRETIPAEAFPIPSLVRQNAILCLLGMYVTWQLLFPLRCLLYPGQAIWTEEGHHFAWHMMLREKDVGLRFYIRDPRTGKGGVVDVRTFLTSRQMSRMAKDSDMILTFVHFLRDHYRSHGLGNLQIRVLALVSLNGRKPQLMIDPSIDYAKLTRTWGPQPWIMPLREPLRREPWIVPLQDWEEYVEVPSPESMIEEARAFDNRSGSNHAADDHKERDGVSEW